MVHTRSYLNSPAGAPLDHMIRSKSQLVTEARFRNEAFKILSPKPQIYQELLTNICLKTNRRMNSLFLLNTQGIYSHEQTAALSSVE